MKKLLPLLLLLLTACHTTKTVYVPVESVKTEYINNTDSIYIHDSIFHEVITKGDTVYNTKYKYKVLREYSTDTIIKIDSIPVIKEVEKIVEVNKIHWWQKGLMYSGIAFLLFTGGWIYFKIK